ncbi:MAG: EAL domain-containing protein, partial [Methylohalobius sp.]|nr:EAL domain-containing protein [Methylohalobius sp.]
SFIKDILSSPADEEIVKSINNVAHSLGLKTIAEYAETSAIVVKLKALDINYAQGYGIAKPIPLHELKLDR